MTTETGEGPARKRAIAPYTLRARQGWVYDMGAEFIVKLGEQRQGRRFAVLEYATDQDEWPGHTHKTEDEVFYVLKGALTFRGVAARIAAVWRRIYRVRILDERKRGECKCH